MARSYCSEDDVKQYLPEGIVTEGQNATPNPMNPSPESLNDVDIEFFIQQACSHIDGALATQYDTPLVKSNQGGDVGYPLPIPSIAALLASQMIWEQRLQGADRQRSDSQKEREAWAHSELTRIQNGERLLVGQVNLRANRFVRNTLMNTPRNPASGGKSDLK
jgi:hypothetical protein